MSEQLLGIKPESRDSIAARFWAKVDMSGLMPEHRPDLGPCWLWTGGTRANQGGNLYGHVSIYDEGRLAHRVSFELEVRPLATEETVDHLCRVTLCVRPSHLEAVSLRDNILRGTSPVAINARKKYCPKGHVLRSRAPDPRRYCPVCQDNQRREARGIKNTKLLVKEAAEILGIKAPTIRQQILNGRITANKRGRDWVLTMPEIRRYARESQGRELGDIVQGAT